MIGWTIGWTTDSTIGERIDWAIGVMNSRRIDVTFKWKMDVTIGRKMGVTIDRRMAVLIDWTTDRGVASMIYGIEEWMNKWMIERQASGSQTRDVWVAHDVVL